MQKRWLLILLFSLPAWGEEPVPPATPPDELAPNKVYRSVDRQGVVEFSDKPSDNAKEITLPKSQGYTPTPIQANSTAASGLNTESITPYKSIAINEPVNESTLRDNTGNVAVNIAIVPALIPTHQLQLLLDGTPQTLTGTHADLTNIDRGAHTLVAQVVDGGGSILISSSPSKFYLLRHFNKPTVAAPAAPAPAPNNNNAP